jgi:hypothetical protein
MEKVIIDPKAIKFLPGEYPSAITGRLVENEIQIYNSKNELLLAYYKCPEEIIKLGLQICQNTKPTKSSRTRHGTPQLSTVYGPLPRIPIREDYCRFSNKSKTEKNNYLKALKLNEVIAEFYKGKHPELYERAINRVKNDVDKSYLVAETPWANININLNQVIKYHFDKGNNPEDLSNVLIIKKNVSGGYLDCPALGVALHQENGWLVFFRGQEILHGVTPCRFTGGSSFRCSIVNYTLKGLKNCYPYEEELVRLKAVKSAQAMQKRENLAKLRAYYEKQIKKRLT